MRLITYAFVLAPALILAAGQMETAFEWQFVDFVWPSEAHRAEAISSGKYDYRYVIPMDVDVDKAGRVFITFIGNKKSPVSLGVVSNFNTPAGRLIKPYPNWDWFKRGDCDSIQNVYRIAIDECNRLWILDAGFVEGEFSKCQAQLLIFDLNTDTWIKTIKIPDHISKDKNGATLLGTPIVETEGYRCEKTNVYIADVFGNAMIVLNNWHLHRIENPIFHEDPKASIFKTGNDTIEFHSGLLGMAVSPQLFPGENKYLYFRPLTSFDLFAADTDVLQSTAHGEPLYYEKNPNIFPSQVIAMAFSSQGTLFYGLTNEIAIGCWNKYVPLNKQSLGIVAQDSLRLQYLNGVKVIKASPAHPNEELWVLSNRFIAWNTGALNANEVNYRVLKGSVQSLVQNTVCDLPNEFKMQLPRD